MSRVAAFTPPSDASLTVESDGAPPAPRAELKNLQMHPGAPALLDRLERLPGTFLTVDQDRPVFEQVPVFRRMGGIDIDVPGVDPGPFPPVGPGKPQPRPTEPPPGLTDQQRRKWETENLPPFGELPPGTSRVEVDALLDDMEKGIKARFDRYVRLMNEATDPKMRDFYQDLVWAMAHDLVAVTEAKGKGFTFERIDAFNGLAREMRLEIKYNVNIVNEGGKPWSKQDLEELERGLSKLPIDHTVENDKLRIISKRATVPTSDGDHAGQFFEQGVILIGDGASGVPGSASRPNIIAETIVHEIGHSKAPKWKEGLEEFSKLSDWRFLGKPENLPSLAKYNDGDVVTVKELRDAGVPGLNGLDDGSYLRISKRDGNVFVVPAAKPPEESRNFVSPYAMTNPHEDFAESFALYYLDREKMRREFPDKFAFMEKMFGSAGG
jgi:hypothetical protein